MGAGWPLSPRWARGKEASGSGRSIRWRRAHYLEPRGRFIPSGPLTAEPSHSSLRENSRRLKSPEGRLKSCLMHRFLSAGPGTGTASSCLHQITGTPFIESRQPGVRQHPSRPWIVPPMKRTFGRTSCPMDAIFSIWGGTLLAHLALQTGQSTSALLTGKDRNPICFLQPTPVWLTPRQDTCFLNGTGQCLLSPLMLNTCK